MTLPWRARVETQLQTADTDTTHVVAADGAGGLILRAETGGGACSHEHVTDTFTAAGGSPETFTLTQTPLWGRRVYVNGLRVWPADVGGSGTSVEVTTAADDQVVIDYEAECSGTGGDLAFPGMDETHGDYTNTLASFSVTGPCFVTLVITATGVNFDGLLTDIVDDAGDPCDSVPTGATGSNGSFNSANGTYIFIINTAGDYHVVTNQGNPYDSGINDGAGTYAVTYPTGTPTGSLAFPGTSDPDVGNDLADIVTGPAVVFLTIDSPLDTGYFLGIANAGLGDDHYISPDVPTGTYAYYLATSDTWMAYAYIDGSFHGGLTNTGSYEVIDL